MQTIYLDDKTRQRNELRNEQYWKGELEDYPLLWVYAPSAKTTGAPPAPPASVEEKWTNFDYVLDNAEHWLANTYFGGDALPVFSPNLGPDILCAWLGAELTFAQDTSWVHPFIEEWDNHPSFRIDTNNHWWKKYCEFTRLSIERGKGKWATAYPDLHTGIDALSSLRSPEKINMDLLINPDAIKRAMKEMTGLFRWVMDRMDEIILPGGQGTSNWAHGWSNNRYMVIGQNDFSCMISPSMYREFCWEDNNECCNYVDASLYHLDGPQAVQHVPAILEYEKLNVIQWVPGAGAPPHSEWMDLLRQIQAGGKGIQCLSIQPREVELLCRELDPKNLMMVTWAASAEEAESIIHQARKACDERRNTIVSKP